LIQKKVKNTNLFRWFVNCDPQNTPAGKRIYIAIRLMLLFFAFFVFPGIAVSQVAVVSSYFNAADPRDEWTEILVIQDTLDMRNWSLRDNSSTQDNWSTPIVFNNIPFWEHMRAGTIIMIWHRQYPAASTTVKHPLDFNPSDGYLELHANDPVYFTGGTFGTSPSFNGSTLNIAGNGDILQLRNTSATHIHALGHKTIVGIDFTNLPFPKLNHTQSINSDEMVIVCPGSTILEYGTTVPQIGTTFTAITTNTATTFGLPNSCAAGLSTNSDFWRNTRQPGWNTPTLTATPNGTYTQVTLNWNSCIDPYSADGTEGYLILRNTSNVFSTPSDGTSYSAGDLIGSAAVVANISPSSTLTYIDNSTVLCGNSYYYRIYAYRFSQDNLNGNNYNAARGCAYNENSYASATANGPSAPVAPSSATSDRNNFCSDDAGNIILSASGGSGVNLEWFENSCGGTLIGSVNNLIIPSPTVTTTYYVRWTSPGCTPSNCISVTVTVSDLPTIADAGPNQSLCGVLTTLLEGNNPTSGAGLWTLLSGTGTINFTNPSLYNTAVNVSFQGTYTLKWTITNGSVCPASEDLVTLIFGNAITVTAGSNSPVCSGNSIQLTSDIAGATYSWTGPGGFSSSEQNPVINPASATNSGIYTITVTGIPGGCPPTTNSVSVIVNNSPTDPISVTSNISVLCADDPGNITLTATGGSGLSLEWFEGACGGTLIGTGTSLTLASPTITTTYYARWTSSSCGNSACKSVTVLVNDLPTQAFAGNDQSYCGVLTCILAGNNPLVGSGVWTVLSASGAVSFTDPTLYNSQVTVGTQGTYSLQWTISNGSICPASNDEVTIIFGDAVSVLAGSNSPVCNGDTIKLTSSITGATYSWTGPGGFTSTEQNPLIPGSTNSNNGSYIVTVSNIPGGCPATTNSTSVTVLNKPATPAISSLNVTGTSQDVCIGSQFPYTIDPLTPGSIYNWMLSGGGNFASPNGTNFMLVNWTTAGGPYTLSVTETNTEGCTGNPVSLYIMVNNVSTASVSIAPDNNPVCNGTTVTFTAEAVNGGSNPFCTWFVNGIQRPNPGPLTFSYIPSDGDKVQAKLESSSPCAFPNPVLSSEIIMSVTSTVLPEISITTPATSLCTGDTATITASINYGGDSPLFTWYVNGILQSGYTSSTFTFIPGNGYSVTATLISNLSCASPNTVNSQAIVFTINQNLLVDLSIAQENVLCTSDPVTLKAFPINSGPMPVYEWYLNNFIIPGQQSSIYTGFLNAGDQVYARVISSLSCATGNPGTSNKLTISKPPLLEVMPVDTINETCGLGNGSISISATGGTGALQYSVNTPPEWRNNSVFDSLSALIPYSVSVRDENGCITFYGVVILSDSPGPVVSAAGGGQFCYGDTVSLSANSSTGILYEWTAPSGNIIYNQDLILNNISFSDSGLYQIIVRIQDLVCSDTAWQTVGVHKLPEVSLGQPEVLCSGTPIVLSPGSGYMTYLWQDGSIAEDFIASDAGIYFVHVMDSAGCAGGDTVLLQNCSQVYFPSAFSPNSDGTNDNFRPVTGGIILLDYSITIYNRWGQSIYKSNDYLTGWDGKLNGNDVPSGLYSYFVSYKLSDPTNASPGEIQKVRGSVTLLR